MSDEAKGSESVNLLAGARVYLSGPMDFVASRKDEAKLGWRARVGEVLRDLGVVVFDPWSKPEVRGMDDFGREGEDTAADRERWTFENSPDAARTRSALVQKYWETLHIDLRMVDTSDFTIAYCPTNVYSVGTPHEIALCRQQHKPVLFVSPPVEYPTLAALEQRLRDDPGALDLLRALKAELPIKENLEGTPSLWYMALVGGESFFDGFGFEEYAAAYGWPKTPLDEREKKHPPKRPLLPFLHEVTRTLPLKWDHRVNGYVRNDDWLLWNIKDPKQGPVTDSVNRRGGKK